MFTLLLASISKKNKGLCKAYSIVINGPQNNLFIDQKDVEQILKNETKGNISGASVVSFKLKGLKEVLEKNAWINEAVLYFDNQDELHVTISEREPVARIFSIAGSSFYIDNDAKKLPLSDKLSARVPVFTSFPERKVLTARDSVLLGHVKEVANYIFHNPFWQSQIAQIDITPEGTFEMFPVVGNHLVKLGDGEKIEEKFRRLMIFYKQVLSKTGFDKYKIVDVRYAGQVVASRFAGNSKVDSIQLRRNVEKLLQHSREAENDTVAGIIPVVEKTLINDDTDSISLVDPVPPVVKANDKKNVTSVNKPAIAVKKVEKTTKPVEKTNQLKPVESKPKAVMPKKPDVDPDGGYN
jgi:cell division protein FtsQ